ncbi:unnamed protein product [Sympodiomycopsis kandeliae]
MDQSQARPPPTYKTALLSGALAGFSVDISLFPLDTLKTRAQSAQGFWAAGGFKGVYNGISSVAAGSAPGAAIFFLTYESLKPIFSSSSSSYTLPPAVSHMLSASIAETAACSIRVPTEVIKSRMQAGTYKSQFAGAVGLADVVKTIVSREGIRGFWKGFGTTVAREIPFTCIQFPLYERLKLILLQRHNTSLSFTETPLKSLPTYQAALVGSFSGGIAAALTTPLDVVKTRLMLVERKVAAGNVDAAALGGVNQKFLPTLAHISKTEGIKGLFKGVVPRTIWISLGGAVFLGSFELGVKALEG